MSSTHCAKRKVSGEEKTIGLVKAYGVKSNEVLVVTIPKEIREQLGVKRGEKFLVKTDDTGRIIYEPVERLLLEKAVERARR